MIKKNIFVLLILVISNLSTPVIADNNILMETEAKVTIFYSKSCPHCIQEIEFLNSLENKCSDIKVDYYIAVENDDLLQQFADKFNTTTAAVPRTFVGDKAFIGFSHEEGTLEYSPVYKAYIGYANVIEDQINELRGLDIISPDNNSTCAGAEIKPGTEINKNSWVFLLILVYVLSYFFVKAKIISNKGKRNLWIAGLLFVTIISFFIFISSQSDEAIKLFAQGLPFPFFVTIIAIADGFNPCAFTVLLILLSLLTHTKKKRDMSIIGFTFILTSAVMYFIFIMAMIFIGSWAFEKYGTLINLVLGSIIMVIGLINIKDFFFFKKGISMSISDKEKKKVSVKARNIVNLLRQGSGRSFMLAIFGTILLGIFVNLVELGCTAILPAVYMTSLVRSFGETVAVGHIVWTLYYALIYVIPLIIIMLIFTFSFKSARVSEEQGKVLKLVSGAFMLTFGIIMIFFPQLLVF
ncbi:MAG: glutaredoxin family protein [Nanoarchaeota archaeon]|nr:glutaredoxin family protein [Nanoarchaeota archaeon]